MKDMFQKDRLVAFKNLKIFSLFQSLPVIALADFILLFSVNA